MYLVVRGEGAERRVPLDKDEVVVGRHEDADVRLADTSASRRHCRLVRGPSGWTLVDGGGANGTLLNGRLVKESLLAPGDVIGIGRTDVLFTDGSSPAAPSAAPLAPPLRPAWRRRPGLVGSLVIVAALGLAVLGYDEWRRAPARREAAALAELERISAAATADAEARRYDAAIGAFERAADTARAAGLVSQAREFEARARHVAARKARHEQVEGEWRAIRDAEASVKAGAPEVTEWIRRADVLIEAARPSGVAWIKDLEVVREKLTRKVEKPDAEKFADCRAELETRLRLDSPDDGRYGQAVAWWRAEFLPKVADKDVHAAVGREIERLEGLASAAAAQALTRAGTLAAADRVAYLERAVARLAGTRAESVVRGALKR